MKGKGKRVLSGLLSLLTILTSVIQPVVTYAAEPEPPAYEAQYPSLETVREFLDVEEIVTAEDYEVEAGSGFDVKSDFSGLEINDEKVRVSFHEAKNEAGQDYDGVSHLNAVRGDYALLPVAENAGVVRLAMYFIEHGAIGPYVRILDEDAADLIQQHQRRSLN